MVTSVPPRLPDALRSAKYWMPGMMSSALPPLAMEAAMTAANAAPASRGSPFRLIMPSYSGFSMSAKLFGALGTMVVLVVIAMMP